MAVGWCSTVVGQTIAGRVTDQKQQSVVAATISLLNAQDLILQCSQTDDDG